MMGGARNNRRHHLSSSYCLSAFGLLILAVIANVASAQEKCFENEELNQIFEPEGEPTCCQQDVCGIPCPVEVPPPTKGM